MENRHAERLTRDVLLTLSSGSNLFYDPFLEFPCVALALVHFSTFIITLLLLFLFFFFPYFYYNYFVSLFYLACIDESKNRSFRNRQVEIEYACNETSNVFSTWKLQPVSRLISLISSFSSRSLQSVNLSRE